MPRQNWKGYVIVRMMFGESGKLRPYTYYPRVKGGKPPFFYKTKEQAIKKLGSPSMKFYKFSNNLKVMKFKKSMYLDRF